MLLAVVLVAVMVVLVAVAAVSGEPPHYPPDPDRRIPPMPNDA